MGFGFNFFFIFILVPLTIILLLVWMLTRKKIVGKTLGYIWLGVFALTVFTGITQAMTAKKILTKSDFYGEYVIDKTHFPGKQASWQYNSFRFNIDENDSIRFYEMRNGEILNTFKGTITTTKPYRSERLIINMAQPTQHILTSGPTIYREAWKFYLVFYSPKFGNVFFTKAKWE